MKKTIMAVGSHADDLEVNIGGTLAKYHDAGYGISYVMSTNNMSGNWCRLKPDGKVEYTRPPYDVIMPQRKLEAAASARYFGTTPVHLDHPQRHYFNNDGIQKELVFGCERPSCVPPDTPSILTAYEDKTSLKNLTDLILNEDPEAVITHGPAMVNIEHFATCLLVTRAYWQAVKAGYGGMLLQWLDITPSIFGETFSIWDTFIDVSDYFDRKMEAIALNACQIPRPGDLDLPPWGMVCGCKHAETFTIAGRGAPSKTYTPLQIEIFNHLRK